MRLLEFLLLPKEINRGKGEEVYLLPLVRLITTATMIPRTTSTTIVQKMTCHMLVFLPPLWTPVFLCCASIFSFTGRYFALQLASVTLKVRAPCIKPMSLFFINDLPSSIYPVVIDSISRQ